MNILLRKLWILSSLILVANADIVFDLNAQQLQNTIGLDANGQNADVKMTPSRYNLPKTYVSTGLFYKNGTYTLKDNLWQGIFYVEIKNPISTWSVDFGVLYYFYLNTHTVKFISDTGKTITLGMHNRKIYFNSPNDSQYIAGDSFSDWTDVIGSVTMDGSNVSFVVNGYTKTISVPNFSKLKYVSISIINDNLDSRYSEYSILKSLTIGSAD